MISAKLNNAIKETSKFWDHDFSKISTHSVPTLEDLTKASSKHQSKIFYTKNYVKIKLEPLKS